MRSLCTFISVCLCVFVCRDLETPSVSAEALLLKHARVSTDPLSGGKMYNSKRPVH